MPAKNKSQNAVDSSEEGQNPRKEEGEYDVARQEALEETEERRIMAEKEGVEERTREHEVRGGHLHTPYFEYDNPSYEDKVTFKSSSPDDKKEHKRKK